MVHEKYNNWKLNYAFNRTFFNKNLFMWRHLETSSDRLLARFSCLIVRSTFFLPGRAGIPWNYIDKVVHGLQWTTLAMRLPLHL